jgi:hypothetical protein
LNQSDSRLDGVLTRHDFVQVAPLDGYTATAFTYSLRPFPNSVGAL